MVNIIMPTYNAHDTIRQAIASIAMQDNLQNILVTIVDDCSDNPYDYLLEDYHYLNLEILRKPYNTGCGQSRQYGIDRCKCEYFTFLDADDCLYSPNSINKLYTYAQKNNLDILYSDFLEELDNGEYLLHENSGIWMHGKLFKTEYVQRLGIRYSDTRANEDHAFNTIALLCGGKSKYIDYITYVWKYNTKSITRSCDFNKKYFEDYIKNAEYTISELIKHNIDKKRIVQEANRYLLSFYGYYNRLLDAKYEENIYISFVNKIKNFWSCMPTFYKKEFKIEDLNDEFYEQTTIQGLINDGIIFSLTFQDFIDIILS